MNRAFWGLTVMISVIGAGLKILPASAQPVTQGPATPGVQTVPPEPTAVAAGAGRDRRAVVARACHRRQEDAQARMVPRIAAAVPAEASPAGPSGGADGFITRRRHRGEAMPEISARGRTAPTQKEAPSSSRTNTSHPLELELTRFR